MSESRISEGWVNGANNIAPSDRLPQGFVRSALNVDVTPGGKFMIRSGFELNVQGTNVHGMLSLNDKLLIADGTDLIEFDTNTNTTRVLRQIAGAGPMVGAVFAGRLFFCTANECLEYDGSVVRRWGVEDVLNQPQVSVISNGSLLEGYYQIAATFSDADGREGGTDKPLIIFAGAGKAFEVAIPAPPAGGKTNLYVSSVEGTTLYRQADFEAATTFVVGSVRDDTSRLNTIMLRAPTPADHVLAHNGMILMAQGKVITCTSPMRPHLVDRTRRFFQFPAPVNAMLSADLVFVSADRSYALAEIETDSPRQVIVLEFPAITGTAVELPDGRGAWMTQYGQAITNGATLELVNRPNYTVGDRDSGNAGVVENNGNQMIVTNTRGGKGPGGLAAVDYFFGEILNP